jgi:pyruvate/2-oxoglutarate dehydrogenase complex dihydrolipoamide acyltransferase (E2) component
MHAPIILPDLGTSPVYLSVWFADAGEVVYEGDRLIEVLIGDATFDVPAPATGRLARKHALPNDTIAPGQVLGELEIDSSPS